MSLLCSTSAALEDLKAKKKALEDSLNGSLASIQSSISSSMTALKDSISGAAPSPPILRDFKSELMELRNKTGLALLKAKEAMNNTWGGAVADLDTLMTNVFYPDFSPCKDAPNVKGKPEEDGTVTVEVVAQPTPAPEAPPEKPTPAPPAPAVDASIRPSSSNSGVSVTAANSGYSAYVQARVADLKSITDEIDSEAAALTAIKGTLDFKAADGTLSNVAGADQFSGEQGTPESRLRKGRITQAQYDIWKGWKTRSDIHFRRVSILSQLSTSFTGWESFRAGKGNGTEATLRSKDAEYAALSLEAYEDLFKKPESTTLAFAAQIKAFYSTSR